MKVIPKLTASLVLIGLLAVPAAHAMRCGNDLVGDGSTKLEVLNACGEPMRKFDDDLEIGDTGLNREGDEKWVYDIGGGVYHVVYFNGFQVRKIEIEQK
ncbi:MAG TPA: DUF2845 domain-containing protein [Desulfosarcina sp.]|nr:DUF2845 domain-containing protein [Desulfosarcina sp.]